MIRHFTKVALLAGALSAGWVSTASAHGGPGPGAVVGALIGGTVIGAMVARPAPVYVQQPVYVAPPPPPVYYAPPPVVYQPAPVYYAPPPPPPGYYYGHYGRW